MKKVFTWDKEQGFATCIITHNRHKFVGSAFCHDGDRDFCSEKTGSYIAELRADILLLQHMRDNELKPAYNAVNHIYHSLTSGKKYQEKSLEKSLVRRQLLQLKNQLNAVSNELATLRKTLNLYIKNKDEFYQRIRKGQK